MDRKRIIFHIDVNNAFLSWTAVDLLKHGSSIDIRTIPSVIGGDEDSRHGIVVAKSPVAKKRGVVTAETLYSARRKCPDLKVFSGNYLLYKEESNKLYHYYLKFTPTVERFSIDECFLDMSGTNYLYEDLIKLAYKMKDDIYNLYGITVNIGIGNNKLCAKMASDFEKPNKVHTLFNEEVKSKMWPLPVGDLLFVGKKTTEKLKILGINTIGDLANMNLDVLSKYFKNGAIDLHNSAMGIDNSPVIIEQGERKSISTTYTLPYDELDKVKLKKILLTQSDEIGYDARVKKLYASTIAIIIRTESFITYSHQTRFINPTNLTDDIYKKACELFDHAWKGEPVRLIGIRIGDFVKTNIKQISLFDQNTMDDKADKVQEAVDIIKDKFGKNIIIPASLKEKK